MLYPEMVVYTEKVVFVNIFKSTGHTLKEGVQLDFNITQNLRDELLMKRLIEFLNCGYLNVNQSKNACVYRVSNLKDLTCAKARKDYTTI